MQAIQQELTIQKDSVIEIHSPLLKTGKQVEVILLFKEKIEKESSLSALWGSGKGSFSSSREADNFIHRERDVWE